MSDDICVFLHKVLGGALGAAVGTSTVPKVDLSVLASSDQPRVVFAFDL